MPSWFQGMNAVLAVAATATSIVAGIVGILIAIGVLGGDTPIVHGDFPPEDFLGLGSAALATPEQLTLGQAASVVLEVSLDKEDLTPDEVDIVPGEYIPTEVIQHPGTAQGPPLVE
jgi:hypothetical protein